MPTKMLDKWEEAARQEVERQAFIDTSLGPKEFQNIWGNKQDYCCDQQGRWQRGNVGQKTEKDTDAIDVNVTRV
jgi:hypothetical protein